MKVKFFKWIVFLMVVIPLILFATVLMIGYVRQDAIVQSQIATLNNQFQGKIAVGDTHLAPFANFPDISIKIDHVLVSESKAAEAALILDVAHIYIGFNLWDLVAGNYDIHSLLVEDGFFDLVLHTDGTTNLENALATTAENTEKPPLAIHL
jgi:hypothetical protein